MGPIGILCVQRTLNKGRLAGLHTGVGASLSDLFYCLLAGMGMSIITDLIATNVDLLQVVGSIILIVYAIYMIVHNPVSKVKKDVPEVNDKWREILSGFLLTLSNPLIILLIFPLFARFGFPLPEHHWYHIILGYALIVCGAMLWWYAITYIVDKVRSRFNINSMWTINRIMGSILLLVSLYGLGTGLWRLLVTYHVI